jgi:TonB family protein
VVKVLACANGEHEEITRYGTPRCQSIDSLGSLGSLSAVAAPVVVPAVKPGVHLRTTEPVLVYAVDPTYPVKAVNRNIQGECLVGVTVDSDGTPHNIRIVKSLSPELDDSAIEAVSQYKFKPATLNGDPIPARIDVALAFHVASR